MSIRIIRLVHEERPYLNHLQVINILSQFRCFLWFCHSVTIQVKLYRECSTIFYILLLHRHAVCAAAERAEGARSEGAGGRPSHAAVLLAQQPAAQDHLAVWRDHGKLSLP